MKEFSFVSSFLTCEEKPHHGVITITHIIASVNACLIFSCFKVQI